MDRPIVEGIAIDHSYSRDIDDAIWVDSLPNGYKVHVHISDIPSYFDIESSHFRLATKRVASEYKDYRAVSPLLTPELSENTLSLLNDVERPCLSFEIGLDVLANRTSFRMYYGRIKTIRLSYFEVNGILKNSSIHRFKKMLDDAYTLSTLLFQKRGNEGALAIYKPEQGLMADDNGRPIFVDPDGEFASHFIVQEMMILANRSVADHFLNNGYPFLFRNHVVHRLTPDQKDIMTQLRISLFPDESTMTWDRIKKQRNTLLFEPASYNRICKGHYALNVNSYTHITSPLRRLTDLINHFLIRSYICQEPPPFTNEQLDKMCAHINETLVIRKEDEKPGYRRIIQEQASMLAPHLSSKTLDGLDPTLFRQLFDYACYSGYISKRLKEEYIFRLSLGIPLRMEMLYLFFNCNTEQQPEDWQELRDFTLAHIEETPGRSYELLNIASKFEKFYDFDIEEYEVSEYPTARIVVTQNNGNRLTTPKYVVASKQKQADRLAAYYYLVEHVRGSLICLSETSENFDSETDPESFYLIPAQNVKYETSDNQGLIVDYAASLDIFCINHQWLVPEFFCQEVIVSGIQYFKGEGVLSIPDQNDVIRGARDRSIHTVKELICQQICETLEEMDMYIELLLKDSEKILHYETH